MMRSEDDREQKGEDGSPQGILGPPQITRAWHIPKAAMVSGSHPLLSVLLLTWGGH